MSQYAACTEVTAQCPVEGTAYGYYPSLPANGFFLGFFALFFGFNTVFGAYYGTWAYTVAMCAACATEAIGYVGRIMLHHNPWSNTGFIMQITCIIIGPAFNSAAMYLTLKYLCLRFGPQWSRIQPRLYTWIFISGDLISLILQGAGGGMAASANGDETKTKKGNNIAMAGIAWQVFTLATFGLTVLDFVYRRAKAVTPLSPAASLVARSLSFRLFATATVFAWITIFIRCIYRIIEFAGGWRNSIMQNETDFIILEGAMIVAATFCQTIFHPGWGFPALSSRHREHFIEEEPKVLDDDSSREASLERAANLRQQRQF